MRVTRYENRLVISCSEHEFNILGIAVDQIELGDTGEFLTETGLRRSWARRTSGGDFLRIDHDRRKR